MKRYLYSPILKDLHKKMVFITGPRQIGKTFLAKQLQKEFKKPVYLNYDDADDARIIRNRSWKQENDLIILDEIHKFKGWKNFLKGTYDTRPEHQNMLITGSARLETFRKSGDSLAGRYFHYRLNPLSVKELSRNMPAYKAVEMLNVLGGFPEPFLSGSEKEAQRWRHQYYTDIVREDILDFTRIQEIRAMRIMVELLRKRVGSPLSYNSLAQDLQIAPNTVRKYISILESLYIIFLITPFHNNIARSILKEPKLYFYDSGYADTDEGIRLENTVALCLLKHIQYLQDTEGKNIKLHYIRTKTGKKIDFVISENSNLIQAIEVKLSDNSLIPNLKYFKAKFPNLPIVQLVHNLRREKEIAGISIVSAGNWLSELSA